MAISTIGNEALASSAHYTGFKNRLINGDMRIDQRNAGAIATVSDGYTLDRWNIFVTPSAVLTTQQVSTAPDGFSNSLKINVTTPGTIYAGAFNSLRQRVEGLNITDLNWGKSNASTVTLSFWVNSSVTGTYSVGIRNSAINRSYVALYSISSANTWEYKTITISGDTTGTWSTTNDVGIRVDWSLGCGTEQNAPSVNSWTSGSYISASGTTSLVETSGAAFYITGVQLEKGSVATSFDYRPYGTELALCQRYYYRTPAGVLGNRFGSGYVTSTTQLATIVTFPVVMRAAPSALEQSGAAGDYSVAISGGSLTCSSTPTFNTASTSNAESYFVVASGLTAGQGGASRYASANAYLAWSAEL